MSKKYDFFGYPVTEDGKMNSKLIGMVCKRDIDFETDMKKPVSEIMTTNLITASENCSQHEANSIIRKPKVSRLPIVNDEISIENSNFPDFVSKSLHYPGMSPYGFFDRESVLYTKYKNKYFEEFIISDIYLDRNVMIRLYFIIGKVGTFLLGKNNFYHTIHPLKNENGRYVWKYKL